MVQRYLSFLVLDINDNSPIFSQETYTFRVPENTDRLSGFNVSASDTDIGLNGVVFYTILDGNDQGIFNLGKTLTQSIMLTIIFSNSRS